MKLFCAECSARHGIQGGFYCAKFRRMVSEYGFCEESGDDEVSEEKREKAYKRIKIDMITINHLKRVTPFEDTKNDALNIGIDANNEPDSPISLTVESGFEGGGKFIMDISESEAKTLADAINYVLVCRYRKERFRDNGQC